MSDFIWGKKISYKNFELKIIHLGHLFHTEEKSDLKGLSNFSSITQETTATLKASGFLTSFSESK